METNNALATAPDLTALPTATTWLETVTAETGKLTAAREVTDFTSFDGRVFENEESPFGRYGSREWRSFALAVLAADWACYPTLSARVDFVRLLFVLDRFPQGFRVWFAKVGDQALPVGYTGWYPIEPSAFDGLRAGKPPILDRVLIPLRNAKPGSHAYLFNYSLISVLRSARDSRGNRVADASPFASQMLRSYADDLARWNSRNLAAVTVSGDGSRVAERFGLRPTGSLDYMGSTEMLYATVDGD